MSPQANSKGSDSIPVSKLYEKASNDIDAKKYQEALGIYKNILERDPNLKSADKSPAIYFILKAKNAFLKARTTNNELQGLIT